jgi:predicted transcriptional regulator
LIRQIYEALSVGTNAPAASPADKLVPAVPVKQSVFPDYIVCLEDGKKLKTLKRYLQAAYGMTPQQYREQWGLPAGYPINAPNYTRRRSALSKKMGRLKLERTSRARHA